MHYISAKQITADGKIGRQDGGPTRMAYIVLTAGSDAATAEIYDDEDGSGTVRLTVKAAANTSQPVPIPGSCLLHFKSRGYVNLSGTGPTLNVGLV